MEIMGICKACDGAATCTYPPESRALSLQCDEFTAMKMLTASEDDAKLKLNPGPNGRLRGIRALYPYTRPAASFPENDAPSPELVEAGGNSYNRTR